MGHELTAVLLSVIMWFADRIMIGRLVQINKRYERREGEDENRKKTAVHI